MIADAWAKRYGQRPYRLLAPDLEDDDPLAAALDLATLQAGVGADMDRFMSLASKHTLGVVPVLSSP